jgi:tetratricopeptide (TPR) repeat protein
MSRTQLLALLLLLAAAAVGGVWLARPPAGESNGTPEARARFTAGEITRRAGKHAAAAAEFRRAIEIDPDFAEAHARFIETTRIAERSDLDAANRRRQQLYESLAANAPRKAVYRWGLGFLSKDMARAGHLFRQALEIDPRFARAHFSLAQHADLRGDWDAQRQHLRAAVDANPNDPQYLIQYARAHRNTDPNRFRELARSVVDKFPDSEAAAEALYHLGSDAGHQERRPYFDRLRASYPADRFGYTGLAMDALYADATEPAQALSVARDMTRWMPASRTWARRAAYQEVLIRAEALMRERRFGEANDALDKAERPSSGHSTMWALMKADAAARTGRPEAAYATLVETVAGVPDDRAHAALLRYGTSLQKTSQEIDADLWRIRDAKATAAPAFELTRPPDGTTVRLSDFSGRVVLLSFWFPG